MIDSAADALPNRLRRRLAGALPGQSAWRSFAPQLSYGRHSGPPAHNARQAAVMVMFYRDAEDWLIPLTLRPDHMADHAGQVCFPGGVSEPGETPEQTALRELNEELDVGGEGIEFLGRLSPLYVFASNFWVTPCVATVQQPVEFHPHAREVAEVVQLPVADLLDEANHASHVIERYGVRFRAPHIICGRHRIWGATSMILGELIEVLR